MNKETYSNLSEKEFINIYEDYIFDTSELDIDFIVN